MLPDLSQIMMKVTTQTLTLTLTLTLIILSIASSKTTTGEFSERHQQVASLFKSDEEKTSKDAV